MLLYHGTAKKYLKTILTKGLRPRRNVGNWEHTIVSNPTLVYLTSTYAPYFGMNAGGEDFLVIELDSTHLDEANFRPDEDGLEQLTRGRVVRGIPSNINTASMEKRTEFFRDNIDGFQQYWHNTLEALGTCAYKGVIPVTAFTRIAEVNTNGNRGMWSTWDPTISLINHMICGKRYQALTRWLMGDEIPPEALYDFSFKNLDENLREEYLARAKSLLENREGIKITKPNG